MVDPLDRGCKQGGDADHLEPGKVGRRRHGVGGDHLADRGVVAEALHGRPREKPVRAQHRRVQRPELAGLVDHLDDGASGGNLVVEDDERTCKAIRETLELLGYQVVTAGNGLDALLTFQEYDGRIDLVLTDMIMPQMGGTAFHHALVEWDPEVKVIFMTGYPLEDVDKRALEQGAVTWIQKPFSMRGLAHAVRKMLAS